MLRASFLCMMEMCPPLDSAVWHEQLTRAIRLHLDGDTVHAEHLYGEILRDTPDHPAANYCLGMLRVQARRPLDALPFLLAALQSETRNPDYWLGYLEGLLAADQLNEASAALDLGRRHGLAGAAVESFSARLDHILAESRERALLGAIAEGNGDEAYAMAVALTESFPERGVPWKVLGTLRWTRGESDAALAAMRRSIRLLPQDPEAHCNLGLILCTLERYTEAEQCLLEAVAVDPCFAPAHFRLGMTYSLQARLAEAATCLRRGLALHADYSRGDDEQNYSNLLFVLAHNPEVSAQQLSTEHRRYGEYFESRLRGAWPAHANRREPGRRLQVGFLSGDLYRHSVSNFLEPILTHLKDSAGVELHAYYNNVIDDAVSRRLQGIFAHWHKVDTLTDAELAAKILAQPIDVLIDLSGHTGQNRLPVLARKPAPIQVSWLGYPGTTGLQAIDYYIADAHWLPPGRYDALFTEKLVYLPDRWAFVPHPNSPPVAPLPALATGHLTFASFHRLGKINLSTVRLWAELLRALPHATLQVIGIPLDGQQHALLAQFAAAGVAPERITCYPRSTMDVYLAMHQHVDIALDTLAYSGATTTMHSLSMGVPTLTLAGESSQARACAGILSHLGLEGFIAASRQDFIAKALYWAQHLNELAALRSDMRHCLVQSPAGNPALIAEHLETALRRMWTRWCARLPATTFASERIDLMHLKDSLLEDLDAVPRWLDYLEALLAAGRRDTARNILSLAKRQGIAHPMLEDFGRRLAADMNAAEASKCPPAERAHRQPTAAPRRSRRQEREARNDERRLLSLLQKRDVAALLDLARRMTERFPERGLGWKMLGACMSSDGGREEAFEAMRKAVELLPQDAEAHVNFGLSLAKDKRFNEAERYLLRALELNPRLAAAHYRLAVVHESRGSYAQAEAALRQGRAVGLDALAVAGDDELSYSHLMFLTAHNPGVSAQQLSTEHRRYGEYFESRLRGAWPAHANRREPGRRLQVGFLSGDLYRHSVSNFLEPILTHLKDSAGVELHAYYNNVIDDAVSRRLQGIFAHWHKVDTLTDAELAAKILAQPIDVLIDLSGHTGQNRLPVLARKPAPIQVSWLGYPGTTGLQAIDYYIADAHWLPPGRYDALFTEKLVYLPDRWAFVPHPNSPPVAPLPALATGHLTFASFHRLGKINLSTVRLWAELLRALPHATLQVIGIPLDGQQHALLAQFAAAGVAPERITCYPRSTMDVYLAMHQHVDIALDTLAYSGATTTMHSLSMGVPTLTLAGESSQARACAGILSHLGLEGFIAASRQDFIAKALYWAQHLNELAALRSDMRHCLVQSPAGNPALIAEHLETALRRMWTRWCARLPATTFASELESGNSACA